MAGTCGSGCGGGAASHGKPRRATESYGDAQRGTGSHGEPRRATEGRGEPRRATESHGGPRRATAGQGGPRRDTDSRGEPRRAGGRGVARRREGGEAWRSVVQGCRRGVERRRVRQRRGTSAGRSKTVVERGMGCIIHRVYSDPAQKGRRTYTEPMQSRRRTDIEPIQNLPETCTEPTQELRRTYAEPTEFEQTLQRFYTEFAANLHRTGTEPKQYLHRTYYITYTGPTQNSHRNCEGLAPNMYRYYSDNTQHLQRTQQNLRRTYAETTHWDAPTYWHCLPGAPRVLQFEQNVNRDSACARARREIVDPS